MEVILKKDLENLGFADDIVNVKDGYGRNFLIPQGSAVLATPSARKAHEEILRQRANKEAKVIAEAQKIAGNLKAAEVKMAAKVGKGNKLFGSLNNGDLADVLKTMGYDIDKKFIAINGGTIKATGKYVAKIRLHRSVNIEKDFDVIGQVD
jgi:large subunit ribosomal protein L9